MFCILFIFQTHSSTALPTNSLGGRRGRVDGLSGAYDFCRDLDPLKLLHFALKRKYPLSERSEFGYFRFALRKMQRL